MELKLNEDPLRDWKLQSLCCSPTRLHSTPVAYDFPGDRFIPNRSLMNLDQAHTLLTTGSQQVRKSHFSEEYRKKLEESLNLDSEGRPFRMLVFRGSPKSSRKSILYIDELRRSDEEVLNYDSSPKQQRRFPMKESRVLDLPFVKDDFYLNIMDWGKNNILAIALDRSLYLWNAENKTAQQLFVVNNGNNYLSSVSWSDDGKTIAAGHKCSEIQLWDVDAGKLIRRLEGHQNRVGVTSWNGRVLTSGSTKTILNHDVRVGNGPISRLEAHKGSVCGLQWSTTGNLLASGGNDNAIYIWEASRMCSAGFMHRFTSHVASVKALAWCPHDFDVLASGGGTDDGCIKLWNIQQGTCISSTNTGAQVCALEWNRHHKEILSGHGFSTNDEHKNKLCLWRYPSMSKAGEVKRHSSRVLQLAQNPDGLVLASAGADETLRFWEIFGPPAPKRPGSIFSLDAFPIR